MTTFISLLVFYFRHATNQGFGVILRTGYHKNIAFDLTYRERHPNYRKNENIAAARHSKPFKTYVLQTPLTSDPHTIDVTHGAKTQFALLDALPQSHTMPRTILTATRASADAATAACSVVCKLKLRLKRRVTNRDL